jgi:alanine racemase
MFPMGARGLRERIPYWNHFRRYADGCPAPFRPPYRPRRGRVFPRRRANLHDQCMVDLGPNRVQRWDHVTIFGPPPAHASAEDVARLLGTIPYEITCGINKRVPRVYVGAEAR